MRLLKHLLHAPWRTRRAFPAPVQAAIAAATAAAEKGHRGEIRFVVEGSWPLAAILAGRQPGERALEVFGLSRAWDTADNTGVLVYTLLCERHVQILADRGIHGRVPPGTWEGICQTLQAEYAAGRFEAGAVQAIAAIAAVLREHFPAEDTQGNELPDEPVILR
jgi:uncharacterized membrane protein